MFAANLLKMWISFMIPKIEDGNNFGVSVQEDTLAEIQTVETEAAAFFDQISRYFLSRAKVVSKVAKYPHIDDYRRAVVELDEKEYLSLWLVVCEVRNRYSSLHDIVIKNMEKLKKPRSSNAENLYWKITQVMMIIASTKLKRSYLATEVAELQNYHKKFNAFLLALLASCFKNKIHNNFS